MTLRSILGMESLARFWLAMFLWAAATQAGAGIFDDEEARRAILDLRQKVETLRRDTDQRMVDDSKRQADELAGLRRSLIDLQNQLDASAVETAKVRGQNEQLLRDLAETQRRHAEFAKAADERMRKLEPLKVSFEGAEFWVEPQEKRGFEAVHASFRKGDFDAAQAGFADFLNRYPQSGYASAALFWLGNAQFVGKDFKSALATFQKLLTQDPKYTRVPEASLAVANCQLELKDAKAARKTLEDLIAEYPRSEAADAAKDRLARLK